MSDEGSSALRQIYAAFTLQADPRQLTSADNAVEGLIGKLQTLGAVLAGSRLISAVANFANGIEAEAHTIENASARLGISTTQYQELAFAADEAGVGQQTLTNSLARMSAQLGQTGGHASKAAQALHGLGIDTHRADGSLRDVADITGDLSDALNGMNPDRMQAVLRQIGGPGMARLAPLMHQGAGGVRELTAEFQRLGGGLSENALAEADRYGAETRKLDVVLDGLKSTLAIGLFPVLRQGIEWVERGALQIKHFTDNSNAMKHGLELLELVVGSFAVEMALANLPVIAGAAALLALGLAYDDVRTFIEGGNSALGRWIDRSYGIGASRTVVTNLGLAWEGVKAVVHDLGDAVDNFGVDVGIVAGGIKDAFGTTIAWVNEHFGGVIDGLTARVNELLRMIGLANDQVTPAENTVTHLHVGGHMENGRMVGGRSVSTGAAATGESEDATQEREAGALSGFAREMYRGFTTNIFDAWRNDVIGGPTAPTATYTPTTATAGGQTVHVTQHVTIPVQGVSGEHVARQIDHHLQRLHRAAADGHDGNMPTNTSDSEAP